MLTKYSNSIENKPTKLKRNEKFHEEIHQNFIPTIQQTIYKITLTYPLAHYTGEIKDVEDYKQKVQKQKQLKNKTMRAVKQELELTNYLFEDLKFSNIDN